MSLFSTEFLNSSCEGIEYKAHLFVKGFTQIYGLDHFKIFWSITHINSMWAPFFNSGRYRMKNLPIEPFHIWWFTWGRVAHIEKNMGYIHWKKIDGLTWSLSAWHEKFSQVMKDFYFVKCKEDHSIFVQCTRIVVIIVSVDVYWYIGIKWMGLRKRRLTCINFLLPRIWYI